MLPLFVGKLATTFSNATEVDQWAAPSCSQPQPATAMASKAVDWPLLHTLYRAVPTERRLHGANEGHKSESRQGI